MPKPERQRSLRRRVERWRRGLAAHPLEMTQPLTLAVLGLAVAGVFTDGLPKAAAVGLLGAATGAFSVAKGLRGMDDDLAAVELEIRSRWVALAVALVGSGTTTAARLLEVEQSKSLHLAMADAAKAVPSRQPTLGELRLAGLVEASCRTLAEHPLADGEALLLELEEVVPVQAGVGGDTCDLLHLASKLTKEALRVSEAAAR